MNEPIPSGLSQGQLGLTESRISRREFLRSVTLLGTSYAAAQVLVACRVNPRQTPMPNQMLAIKDGNGFPTGNDLDVSYRDGDGVDQTYKGNITPEIEKQYKHVDLSRDPGWGEAHNVDDLTGITGAAIVLSQVDRAKLAMCANHVDKRRAQEVKTEPNTVGHHWKLAVMIAGSALLAGYAKQSGIDARTIGVIETTLQSSSTGNVAHFMNLIVSVDLGSLERYIINQGSSLSEQHLDGLRSLASQGMEYNDKILMILRMGLKNVNWSPSDTAFFVNKADTFSKIVGEWIPNTIKDPLAKTYILKKIKEFLEKAAASQDICRPEDVNLRKATPTPVTAPTLEPEKTLDDVLRKIADELLNIQGDVPIIPTGLNP